jgi:hypothetical protein
MSTKHPRTSTGISHHLRGDPAAIHFASGLPWFVALMVAGLSLGSMGATFAAPPDLALVPAEVDWFIHADFDALRNSTTCRQIMKRVVTRWKSLAMPLEQVKLQFGVDLARDLHDITVFGPRASQGKAVLIMRADWASEPFRRSLALAPSHTATVDGPYEIHHFTQKDRGQFRPVVAVFWKHGIFVFGQAASDVKSGLEVLDGNRPSLSGQSIPLAAKVPDGTILVARMIRVGDSLPVESPLLKQANRIDFVCGEYAGEWFVHGELETKSTEAAQHAKRVAEGLLAIARLRLARDSDLLNLLDRTELGVNDRCVDFHFQAPAQDVAGKVEKALEQLSSPTVK